MPRISLADSVDVAAKVGPPKASKLSRAILLVMMFGLLSGCEFGGLMGLTGDKDRYKLAFDEIQVVAGRASERLVAGYPAAQDERWLKLANEHFDLANRMMSAVLGLNIRNAPPQTVAETLISYSKILQAKLTVVSAPQAFATAFPNGRVIVSDSLIATFTPPPPGEFDEVLLGIFIHELAHIYDAHAVQQWMTADGRRDVVGQQVATVASALAGTLFSSPIQFTARNEASFRAAAEYPQLSEHAADLAAVGILKLYGADWTKYVQFIRDASARASGSKSPFSWLQPRSACLDALQSGSPPSMKTLLVSEPGIAQYEFDAARLEAETAPTTPDDTLFTFKQNAYYTMCAVDKSFANQVRRADGVVTVPFFDIRALFFQF